MTTAEYADFYMTYNRPRVKIALETATCGSRDDCANLADGLYRTLSSGRYDRCSVLPVPSSIAAWMQEHRTARKRVMRCERRGYYFNGLERELYADDIHAINTSLDERQGRPMSAGYLERQEFSPLPDYPCSRHAIRTSGVFSEDGTLVAYIVTYRSGDLVLVSQILGHADHLDAEIMYLLFAGALERELGEGGYVVYNRWDSGTDGLRFFKERLGFREETVEWLP